MGSVASAGRWRTIADTIRRHPWVAVWLSLIPFVLIRAGTLAEGDTFWQIRTGLVTLSDGRIPRTDPFSWTAHGEPWTQNSWGFNVVLALVYRVAGLAGVALACAAVVAVIFAIVLVIAKKSGAHPVVAAAVLQVACGALTVYMSARPQLVDYVAVLLLLLLLGRMLDSTGPPVLELATLAVMVALWVNLHAAAPLGVAIIGVATVLVCLSRKTRPRTGWFAAATLVAAVCTLPNPYGMEVFAQSFRVADASTELISEWQPLDPTNPLQLLAFLPGAVALCLAVRRRDPVYVAALGVTAAGSVGAIRFLPLLLLVALPVLASSATSPAVLRYIVSRRVMLVQAAVVGLIAMTTAAVIAMTHVGRADPATYPSAMVAAIPHDCRLWNTYDVGDYVILERPDVRVFIDGRNDMYGVDRVRTSDHALLESSDRDLAGAGCALVPSWTPLAHFLRGDAGWRKVTADDTWTLYARR